MQRAAPAIQHRVRNSALLCLLLALSLLTGACAAKNAGSTRQSGHSAAAINADPMSIDGIMLVDCDLSGLRLRNVTLRNTSFLGCTGKDIQFDNVRFENCRFINTRFSSGSMRNVTFKGGLFTCENDRDNLATRSVFSGLQLQGLLFDGVSMDNFMILADNATVTWRNMHAIRAFEPVLTGRNIKLLIENCIFMRIPAITDISGDASLTVRDSTFATSSFGKSIFKRVLFERCITYGGAVYTPPAAR